MLKFITARRTGGTSSGGGITQSAAHSQNRGRKIETTITMSQKAIRRNGSAIS